MNILVFDTVLDKTYLSIQLNDKIIYKILLGDENTYHSAYLPRTIKDLLDENNVTLADFDYIGTNIGTGSFTGIRTALSIVKVMTDCLNIKAVPFNTFEVLEKEFKNSNILLDARRKSAFYYNGKNKPDIISYDRAVEILKESGSVFVCDKSLYENEFFASCKNKLKTFEEHDLAEVELEIVKNKIEAGQTVVSNDLKPLYIQTPPIFIK